MSIKLQIPGREDRVLAKLEGVEKASRRGIRAAWFQYAKDLKAEANRAILAKDKAGRVYIIRDRAGRRRRHRASAPGQSHANRTGALRRSLSWQVFGDTQMDFGYGASATTAGAPRYAKFVEEGTSRMEARPSLENAVSATQANLERAFLGAVFREFK